MKEKFKEISFDNPQLHLFSLSWPIFIDLAMHFITILINTWMVSMISIRAVAELNVGGQVFQLGFTLFNFVNVGVCVCCAQALGNGNRNLVRRIFHMSFGLNIIWGLAIFFCAFFGSSLICDVMNIPVDIYEVSNNYLKLFSFVFLAEALNLCCGAILRAHGRTRDPMVVNILMNFLTVLGNYCLLFGNFGFPQMGIYGAAVSTVFFRYVCVGLILYLVLKRTIIHLIFVYVFDFKKKVLSQIFSISLPGAGENLLWMLQFLFMTSVVGTFGTLPLATHGIYGQMCGLILLFSLSIALGTEILVARYIGAKKFSLANKQLLHSVKIGIIITGILAVNIPIWLGQTLFSLFTEDPAVISMAKNIFYISVIMEVGRILNIIIINSLRAVGDTIFPVVMAVASMWGISVPVGLFLGVYLEMGLLGVWIGFCADECIRGILMLVRWRKKAWVKSAAAYYRKNYMKKKTLKLKA